MNLFTILTYNRYERLLSLNIMTFCNLFLCVILNFFLNHTVTGILHNSPFSLCCHGHRCISSTSRVWRSWNIFSTRWYYLWGHQISAESLSRALWGISYKPFIFYSSWFLVKVCTRQWYQIYCSHVSGMWLSPRIFCLFHWKGH